MLPWSSGATLHIDCHRFTQPENQKCQRNQFGQDLEDTLYLEVEALLSHLGVCHLACASAIKAHPCCFKYVGQGFTCMHELFPLSWMLFLLPVHWVATFSCFLTSSLRRWDSLFLHCPVSPRLPSPLLPSRTYCLSVLPPSLNKVAENRAQLIRNVISASSWHGARHIIVTQQINGRMFISERSGKPEICYLWFAHLKIINTLWMLITSEFSQRRMDGRLLWNSQDVFMLGWTPTHNSKLNWVEVSLAGKKTNALEVDPISGLSWTFLSHTLLLTLIYKSLCTSRYVDFSVVTLSGEVIRLSLIFDCHLQHGPWWFPISPCCSSPLHLFLYPMYKEPRS